MYFIDAIRERFWSPICFQHIIGHLVEPNRAQKKTRIIRIREILWFYVLLYTIAISALFRNRASTYLISAHWISQTALKSLFLLFNEKIQITKFLPNFFFSRFSTNLDEFGQDWSK